MGVIRLLLRLGLGIGAGTLAAVMLVSWYVSEAYPLADGLAPPVDAVIVLGASFDPDGRLGYDSRRRAASAAALLAAGGARVAIMSGGPSGRDPTRIAGELMRAHAVAAGADPARVLAETRSTTTFENLRFSFEIAEAEGLDRLAILSDPFHLARARALAAWLGRPGLPIVAAEGFDREKRIERAFWLVREAMAWWYNLGKAAGWEALGALGLPEAERARWIR